MPDPVVSIVIPAHNAGGSLIEAVDSALGQTFADLEVVVVDDGSVDGTTERLRGVEDERLRVISQENHGQSSAINKGVEVSRGEYIKVLDADDWLNPAHIESQLAALDGSDRHVASCRWGYFLSNVENLRTRDETVNRNFDDPLEWLSDSLTCDEGMMGGWMWLIPRRLWQQAGGFDPRLGLNNDFHFSVNLLLASEGVRFAEKAVYGYRKGVSGALSASAGRAAMESAYLTTDLGTQLLLQREDSQRIRKICADRFQHWLFRFYPEYPDLALRAEQRIAELGGSSRQLQGGRVLKLMKPLIGWKGVRRLQTFASRMGWEAVLRYKADKRLKQIDGGMES